MKRHCMFQYATQRPYIGIDIYEDTDLITWQEALDLWNKYKLQVIREISDETASPQMVIWTGCEDNTDYSNEAFSVDGETLVENGEFVKVVKNIVDPNKVTMGEPV